MSRGKTIILRTVGHCWKKRKWHYQISSSSLPSSRGCFSLKRLLDGTCNVEHPVEAHSWNTSVFCGMVGFDGVWISVALVFYRLNRGLVKRPIRFHSTRGRFATGTSLFLIPCWTLHREIESPVTNFWKHALGGWSDCSELCCRFLVTRLRCTHWKSWSQKTRTPPRWWTQRSLTWC